MPKKKDKQILGAPRLADGKVYVEGDEDEFAEAATAEEVAHLEEKGVIRGFAGSGKKGGTDADPLTATKVEDLPDALQAVDDIDRIKAAKAADTRKTAPDVYDARIAELEGGE